MAQSTTSLLKKAMLKRGSALVALAFSLVAFWLFLLLHSWRQEYYNIELGFRGATPLYPRLSDDDEPFRWHVQSAVLHVQEILEQRRSSSASATQSYREPTLRKPCGAHLEYHRHWVNRPLWRTLDDAFYEEKTRKWQYFLRETVPTIEYSSFDYEGRGIVYTASGLTVARALTSIRMLRQLGCRLPIEIWYMKGEMLETDLEAIASLQVTARDLLEAQKHHPTMKLFQLKSSYTHSRNYHIKTLAVLYSSFQEVLYLDSDNMPVKDPSYLFDHLAYQQTGSIFWPDFWKFPIDNPMWRITGQQCEEEHEQESGQMVIDKQRVWSALLVSMFFQLDHRFYFRIMLGDKDTYRFAWKVTNTTYHMVQHPLAIAGRTREGHFCGHTMVQHDVDGEILFMHTSAMKTTNAIRMGNTWEAIMYLDRVDPIVLSPPSKNTLSFAVSFAVPREFAGGREKLAVEGGTGPEVGMNPCITYSIQRNVSVETTVAAVEAWGSRAIDSWRIITEDFRLFRGGRYHWFEEAYFQSGAPEAILEEKERKLKKKQQKSGWFS